MELPQDEQCYRIHPVSTRNKLYSVIFKDLYTLCCISTYALVMVGLLIKAKSISEVESIFMFTTIQQLIYSFETDNSTALTWYGG